MVDQGFVVMYRKIMDNPIFRKPEYCHIWDTLIYLASYKEENSIIWNGKPIVIKRGQLLTGRKKLSSISGVKESTVERALKYLESEHMIEQQKFTKFRIITVSNYDRYQSENNKMDNRRTTEEQQTDTYNKDNNVNKENNTSMSTSKSNKESAYKKNNNLPLQEIVDHFNTTFNGKVTSTRGFEKNANIWLKEYSVEQIKEAITNWYYDLRSGKPKFFATDPSLVLLFRTKNRGGECDYIGDLLNIKVNKSKMIERNGVLYLSDRDFK